MAADGEDVQVRFGADTAQFNAGVAGARDGLTNVRAGVIGLVDAFTVLGGAATGSFRQMKSGAAEASESVKGAGEAVRDFREAVVGLGEVLIAAFAIREVVEFAKKMGEAGEQIEHTGLALGMTTGEVQGLQAVANATGMSLEGVTGAAMRLERALGMAHTGVNNQSRAFQKLGIDIDTARTPAELFNAVIVQFADLPPSLEKSQEAMALFGRNILEVAPLIGLTKDQIAEVTAQTQKYGLANLDAVAQAAKLGEAFNENKNASQGFHNVLAQALAPTLTVIVQGMNDLTAAFIQSYNAGGAAKVTLEALDVTFKVIVATVHTVAVAFLELWHVAVGAIEAIIAPVYALGGALDAVLKGKGISGGVSAFKAQMADMSSSAQGHFRAAAQASQDYVNFEEKLWSGHRAKGVTTPPVRTLGEGLGTAKEKKAADDWMQARKEAFLEDENNHNAVLQNELADELAYWQKLMDGGEVPPKHRLEVERRIQELIHQLRKQDLQEQVADANEAKSEQVAAINAELQARMRASQDEIRATQDAARQHQISWQQAHDKIRQLIADETQAQKQAALQIYTARIQADEQIKAHYAENTTEFKKQALDEQKAWQALQDARVKADAEANAKMAQNDRAMTDQLRAQWKTYIDGTVQAFGSGIKGMIEGTTSFRDVILSLADSILQVFINIGERMLENWLLDLIMARTQQGLTGVAQVTSNAAVAASAAFASTAAIPIIGPELAPEAAALAFAGAMSWAPLAAAAGGWDRVPYDDYPSLLHKDEMVLPASIASPLRSMIAANDLGPPASSGAGSPARGLPPMHFHLPSGMTPNDAERNAGAIVKVVKDAIRRREIDLSAA